MSSDNQPIEPGDVVQIAPDAGTPFDGMYAFVDEVRGWGVLAYVTVPGITKSNPPQGFAVVLSPTGGPACGYVRLHHGKFERVGVSPWRLMADKGDPPHA